MNTRKSRHGARGIRKVKTGCGTCKIRHKKCDEARPACSNCVEAGLKCDFASLPPPPLPTAPSQEDSQDVPPTPPLRILRYPPARPLLDHERGHMEYFQIICAPEFSLFFDLPVWENLVLRATLTEPALHHAALAIGSLSSSRYHSTAGAASSATSFAIRQYALAIQALHRRLDRSPQSVELPVLASVVFGLIEFLLGLDSQLEVHFRAGCAMLENLSMRQAEGSHGTGGYDLLANAVSQLTAQVDSFVAFRVARRRIRN
ncbi:hypothetical protein BO71DRAFT_485375 [Aspergillus ellipticus CBS 707.79]|uniref:Zn(2)-C6 fungal-type domain-containing protein n=1 Tax=Aspergillus ellipticus CBS 707.79 TaxID=1448320 RepID=A0A319D5C2_9EURO|nr:hypothetical protein BO71DRAFT_485375 [Aspergillus ellipticus CBS 707.79]